MGLANKVLAEPLVHFVLAGVVIAATYVVTGRADEREVLVEAARLDAMVQAYERQRGREPTASEREAFLTALAREEILVREARALGLDDNDAIVRRRLAQKMEFALEELHADTSEPDDATLQAYLDAHAERYTHAPRRGFVHVYVAPAGVAAEAANTQLEQTRARVEAGTDPATLGLPFTHGRRFDDIGLPALERRFGRDFARALAQIEPGRWQGLASTYGWHLVRVDAVADPRAATLDEVRGRVLVDWREDARRAAIERGFEAVRSRYRVRVVEPAD